MEIYIVKENIDWIIHLVIGENNKFDDGRLDGTCDAHSHGLDKYCGRELQVVLNNNAYINLINKVGLLAKENGEKIYAGKIIYGMFDDDALLRVDDALDCYGKPIWRLIIPDYRNKFPEESDEWPYVMQNY